MLADLPPVGDLPNHVARIWLLSGGIGQGPLGGVYEARWWQASTNIGVDLAGVMLAGALPLDALSKLLTFLMIALPATGAIALNMKAFRGFHAWQLAAIIPAWGGTAAAGFLAFQIAIGAALWMTVINQRSGRTPTIWAHATTAAFLLLVHPFGVAFYLVLQAGLLLPSNLSDPYSLGTFKRASTRLMLIAAACLLPVVLLMSIAPAPPNLGTATKDGILWWRESIIPSAAAAKAIMVSPLLTYEYATDFRFAALLVATPAMALLTRKLRVHAGLCAMAVALMFAALIVPHQIGDASYIPVRFAVMAVWIFVASVRPFPSGTTSHFLAVVMIAITTLRLFQIGTV